MTGLRESRVFQEFAEVARTIANSEVTAFKDQGGKIIGYFCAAMPAEMITAAGMLPFRLRATGSEGTELSDSCFTSLNCSFPRHAFNMALQGGYDFIDGLVMFNSCDHIRRVYDHWIRQVDTPFVRILSLPRKTEPAQINWFRDELTDLRKDMQKHFSVEITDDKLRDAIKPLEGHLRAAQSRQSSNHWCRDAGRDGRQYGDAGGPLQRVATRAPRRAAPAGWKLRLPGSTGDSGW